MSKPVIQTSFNAGEWAPQLNARVDLAKYHSGAALLRNFIVDYRGGATTRPGSRYILQTFTQDTVRLIRFQASFTVSYLLEFGGGYIRFFNNGSAVLESQFAITGVTQANPGVITLPGNNLANGDWVFISGVNGMTQLNGNYYTVSSVTANTFIPTDLNGNPINTTGFSPYTSGGVSQRVYALRNTPYAASELSGIRFTQNVNQLILCHPNHPPYVLTLITAANWTLAPITFGATLATPSPLSSSSAGLAAGNFNYAYVVTAVDVNGIESAPSNFFGPGGLVDIRLGTGTITITWHAVTGAVSYNVYRAQPNNTNPVPAGSLFGFCGNVTGTTFYDSNIAPNYAIGPPIAQNPFSGAGVSTVNITNNGSGSYSSVAFPGVTFSGGGGSGATGFATISAASTSINNGGALYTIGQVVNGIGYASSFQLLVTSTDANGAITSYNTLNPGSLAGGTLLPTITIAQPSGSPFAGNAVLNVNWIVINVQITSPGVGYSSAPAVSFSTGSATAVAVLGTTSSGNPTVPAIKDQRLILAGPVFSPQQFNFSQPGSYFNYNTSNPIEADDAFQGTLTSNTLNTIQSLTPVAQGLLVLTDQAAWIINGGAAGQPVTALSAAANPQSYAGSSVLPPIVTPTDVLYVQAKNSTVRDIRYDFYLSTFVGTDISILSTHLFYGFTMLEWAWAEEPFKNVWVVRNDGQFLTLTFLKEQELVAWSHQDTQGLYKSVASVTEPSTLIGVVDAVYYVVQRTINGVSRQYIERFVELAYPSDYKSSWQVDAGIGYNSTPATTFSGAQHLAGMAVTGVADGVVINFTMPTSGTFVFGPGGTPGLTGIASASIVTVGLSFLPQLQTLRLDLGEPTVQGKRKKIAAITARVRNALGLSVGNTFQTLVPMQDLILGNVGTMSNQIVTGLVTEDARTVMDPNWTVQGQVCFEQDNPYPASILGVIPEIEVGDDA